MCSNYFRNVEDGFVGDLWVGQPQDLAPSDGLRFNLFPWAIERLLIEGIALGSAYGLGSVRHWADFAGTLDHLREVENESYAGALPEDVTLELFRIAHRQFSWQQTIDARFVARTMRMFQHADLAAMVSDEFGLSPDEIFLIALTLSAHFEHHNLLRVPINTDGTGIDPAVAAQLLDRFCWSTAELQKECRARRSIDLNFPYTPSPFQERPLVKLEGGDGYFICCPVLRHLRTRLLDGLYYDLVVRRDFPHAYGMAFQEYVEGVAERLLGDRLDVVPEQPYGPPRLRKDSVDLILSDQTADLFVECKTRRVSRRAKYDLAAKTPIVEEIDKLVESVVKTYKNLAEGLGRKYEHWQPRALPTYLLLVLSTDWYLVSPELWRRLRNGVVDKLREANIGEEILAECPISICSAEDFELLCIVLKEHSIDTVIGRKTDAEHSEWLMGVYLNRYYRAEIVRYSAEISSITELIEPLQDRLQNE